MEYTPEQVDEFAKALVTVNEIQALEQKKVSLEKEVNRLFGEIKNLDLVIENHDANQEKYQTLLSSTSALMEKKQSMETENVMITEKNNKYKNLVASIDSAIKKAEALQGDISNLMSHREKIKNEILKSAEGIKTQLSSIVEGANNIISQLE